MIQTKIAGWPILRWLRLLTGLVAIVMAFLQKEISLGGLGIFMLLGSFTNNHGCCSAKSCNVHSNITK